MSSSSVNIEGGEERGLEGFRLGLLAEITVHVAAPASSAGVERVFSAAGNTVI